MSGLNLTDAEIKRKFGDDVFKVFQQAERLNVGGTYVGAVRNETGQVVGKEVRQKINDGPKAEQRRAERLISLGKRIEKGKIALPPGTDRRLLAAVCYKKTEKTFPNCAQIELMRLKQLEARKPQNQQNTAIMSVSYNPEAMMKRVDDVFEKIMKSSTTLPDRLDGAYEIYQSAKLLLSDPKVRDKAEEMMVGSKMLEGSMDIIATSLNTKSKDVAIALMEERIQNRGLNPEYIPGSARPAQQTKIANPHEAKSRGQYHLRDLADKALRLKREQLLAVNQESRDLDKGIAHGRPGAIKETKMFTSEQRNAYRIYIKDGKFVRFNNWGAHVPCDTGGMHSHNKNGYAAYVFNVNGEISIFNHAKMRDQIAHSSMNAGASVLAAGEIKIKNGQLTDLTGHSGHYRPTPKQICAALKEFQRQGIDISQAKIRLFDAYPGLTASRSPQEVEKTGLAYTYDAKALLAAVEQSANKHNEVKSGTGSQLVKGIPVSSAADAVMGIPVGTPLSKSAAESRIVKGVPVSSAAGAAMGVPVGIPLGKSAKMSKSDSDLPPTFSAAMKIPLVSNTSAAGKSPQPAKPSNSFNEQRARLANERQKLAGDRVAAPAAGKSPQPAKPSNSFNEQRARLTNERKKLAGDRVGLNPVNPLRKPIAEQKRTPVNDAKAPPTNTRLRRP